MLRTFAIACLAILPALSFSQVPEGINIKEKLKAITNGYYMAYNEHSVEKIVRFYADDAVLFDEKLNHTVSGKENFKRIATDAFNGPSKIYKNLFFKVYGMEQQDYTMIVRGEMQNIEWQNGYFQNWKFTTYIDFNEAGKIIKQRDVVDYPEDVLYFRKK